MNVVRQNRFFRVSVGLVLFAAPLIALSAFVIVRITRELQQQIVLERARAQLAPRTQQLLRDLQETEEQRRLLGTIRPSQSAPVSFVTGVEAVAARAGLAQTIAALPASEDARGGAAYAAPVIRYRVTLECSLDACATYLRELTRLPHLVSVETAEFQSPPGQDLTRGVTATLLLALAVRPAEAPRPPARSQAAP